MRLRRRVQRAEEEGRPAEGLESVGGVSALSRKEKSLRAGESLTEDDVDEPENRSR